MKKLNLLFILVFFLIVSFFIDEKIIFETQKIRSDIIDPIAIWFTNLGPIVGAALLLGFLFFHKEAAQAMLILLSFAIALEGGFLLKLLFNVPRPYEMLGVKSLTESSYQSFPSMHTAFVFAPLPFFTGKLKKYRIVWVMFAILIALSRLYAGVHFVSDIIGGALLGLSIGFILDYVEQKYHVLEKFFHHIHDKFELRRQIAHGLTGIAIIILIKLGYLNALGLFIIAVAGGILIIMAKKYRIPILHEILVYFERPHHMEKFPGRGSFFLVIGALMALLLFPREIAFAAIAIMAVGDSVTNIFGRYFGKIKNPLNTKKTIEGTAVAIMSATLAAAFFIPFYPAFMGSSIAMIVESIDLKIGRFEIDDNLIIPILAGWTIAWLG